jgi:Ca2+-binding EF-hand superfamily protein
MRKALLAAAGFAALAGVAGLALAQDGGGPPREHRGVFQSDANSDGVLTRQEFDAGRDANFQRLDANNDGQLTREERRAERGHRGGRGRHGGGMFQLARADANNDGNITREEFLARPTEMFDRMDANDDGVISSAERPRRRERPEGERRERVNPDANGDQQLSRAEYSAMGATMFDRLDGNDDGRVTREEAEAMRRHRGGR